MKYNVDDLLSQVSALAAERNNAWAELRDIRAAINADAEESTLDEVVRVVAERNSLQSDLNDARNGWEAAAAELRDQDKIVDERDALSEIIRSLREQCTANAESKEDFISRVKLTLGDVNPVSAVRQERDELRAWKMEAEKMFFGMHRTQIEAHLVPPTAPHETIPADSHAPPVEPVLDKPVRIGNGNFMPGVKVSTALDAAHRRYLDSQRPEVEAERITKAREAIAKFHADLDQQNECEICASGYTGHDGPCSNSHPGLSIPPAPAVVAMEIPLCHGSIGFSSACGKCKQCCDELASRRRNGEFIPAKYLSLDDQDSLPWSEGAHCD